jgi:ABC-type spermidine/putrescine transport system permease subunit II
MAGAANKTFALSSGLRGALWVYASGFYIFLYGPLLMIAVLSFNDSPVVGFPFRGFTLRWYWKIFATGEFVSATVNSFGVGVIAALVSTALALLLALGFRRQFPFKSALFNLVLMPIVMPGIVGGIVLLLFFGYLDVRPSLYTTVLIAHINWVLPFAFLTIYPRIHNFDVALEEAAMDLGARPLDVFLHVVFPIVRPAFMATALFSFSLSFDEFVRTLFVTGYDRTIPVMFWSMIVDQLAPELPAMAVVIIFISATMSLVGALVSRRSSARSQLEAGQES